MDITAFCSRDLVAVPASASVREAAAAMRDRHVGALAVTDPYQPDRVIGLLTDRDLVVDLLASGRAPDGVPVGEVCRADLAGIAATASLQEAVLAMHRSGTRRLLVMRGDEVVGIVSYDDLLQAVARELDALSGTLRAGLRHEQARMSGDSDAPALFVRR